MSTITVLNKGNVPTGPFTREEVAAKLQGGEFSLDDLAFVEGLSEWTPLRNVLAKVDGSAPPPMAPPVMPPAIAPGYSYAATMQPPPHLAYGGFWLRFVAYMIDSLILSIPFMVIFGILGGILAASGLFPKTSGENSDEAMNAALPLIIGGELVFFAVLIVASWLYYAMLESGPQQSTYGKRVMGLRVTNMEGSRISFGHASGRFFGKIITGLLPFAIGYIMAAFTEKKQALHDMIASTLVIKG